MKKQDPCGYKDTVLALEATLRLLQNKSRHNKNTGACIWQAKSGTVICVKLLESDAAKIPGAVFVGGECHEAMRRFGY